MKRFIFYVLCTVMIYWTVLFILPYDSTDDEFNKERSMLVLYTDHGTGCQYIRVGIFGTGLPRMDGRGRQIGCR